ncbi:hypothetical protein KP005_10295 [Geomonas nitrogeniifigens]|uniref:Cytochrome c-552/4 domain-containing protein n=1 Tax=Geomonas diazotrophica TaxID=2843197 RepID=A0ABX8JMN1_9BACT|nr:multiheme c-type cytochrome [Geomonas nitrogeniifigens]QWV99634.1 hypothetical protein KP005_10295 [Geomonas nitrogeniifigens]
MQKVKFFAGWLACGIVLSAAPAMALDSKNEFAGSEACKKCHTEEYNSWKETFHSKIVQTRRAGILKDAVAKWRTDGKNAGPSVSNATGNPAKMDDVQYVVGSRWKQRFLVKNEQTGNLQFLNKQFNRLTGQWENYGNKNDWDTNCVTCHTTGYRILDVDEATGKTLKSEFIELGVGCESCHGPGMKHLKAVKRDKKSTIFNPANFTVKEQSRVCGYCHVRSENQLYKTSQGTNREDLPAPNLGDSFTASDDWTNWYPDKVVIPGVQPDQPFNKEYGGDLKGLFNNDDFAKANGIYEEAMYHAEYQGFLQSNHYKSGMLSCITCHAPHAGKGRLRKVARDACHKCHDASYTAEKYMPNTGKSADNYYIRSHTFSGTPRQPAKGTAAAAPTMRYE